MIAELLTRGAPREPSPVPAHTLPTQQRAILEFVLRYYQLTGEGCSASYVARRFRVHHSSVQRHFAILYRKGWLRTATGPAVPSDRDHAG